MNTPSYWIIGDAHGCYHSVLDLIQKIGEDEHLVFTGDLVDRGRHSRLLIALVMERGYRCVMGNHELMMLRYFGHGDAQIWSSSKAWGGAATIESYALHDAQLVKHLEWMSRLPYYLLEDRLFITHGFGLPYFGRKDEPKYREKLAWSRLEEHTSMHEWEDFSGYELFNVFGHTPYKEPLIRKYFVGIDTGCAYGRRLSALHYPSLRVVQVDAHRLDL